MDREHSPPKLSRIISITRAVGALAVFFVLIDLTVYLINESNRNLSRENARVLACYENPSAKGCEKEAAVIQKHKEQLENEEQRQRLQEEEKLANEVRRDQHKSDMTPICAAIAMQHYTMITALRGGDYILSNTRWHDAGCRELFGSIRGNEVRNHPSLPSDWASMNFKGAFPEKCWWVNGDDLAPCTHR